MEKLCNINNVGIYIDSENPIWLKRTKELLNVQIDGFKEYFEAIEETKQIIVKSLAALSIPGGSIIVPENAAYFPDGTFYSEEAQVAFKQENNKMFFWVEKQTWYLPYILQYLLMDEGKTFVHGAAVSVNNDKGILITAFGGIGKTCFIANALKQENIKLLGDDLIIIGKNGELTAYPRPFCLYPYHKALFPAFFEGKKFRFKALSKITYFTRITKKLKEMLKVKDSAIYNYLPVSPIHLFPQEKLQATPVKVEKVYMMRRVKGINDIQIKVFEDINKAVDFTQNIITHEWDLGMRLLFNKSANDYSSLQEYIDKQHQIIEGCFTYAKSVYLVDIPEEMSATNVSINLTKTILGADCE